MFRPFLALALVLAACGGGAAETTTTTAAGAEGETTTSVETTTTAVETTTEAAGPAIGIDEIPSDCLDAFVGYLRLIEPVVEPVDWESVSVDQLDQITTEIQTATDGYVAEIEALGCDQLNVEASDEESFTFMIDLARREAPGTVGYLEWIRDFTTTTGAEASGDCETDIAALQVYIDEGVPMSQLPLSEVTTVSNLFNSISTNCTAERATEFMSQPSTLEFMGG